MHMHLDYYPVSAALSTIAKRNPSKAIRIDLGAMLAKINFRGR